MNAIIVCEVAICLKSIKGIKYVTMRILKIHSSLAFIEHTVISIVPKFSILLKQNASIPSAIFIFFKIFISVTIVTEILIFIVPLYSNTFSLFIPNHVLKIYSLWLILRFITLLFILLSQCYAKSLLINRKIHCY